MEQLYNYIPLIGIVIIVVGFILKFDVLATVLVAGIVTGIAAGMDIREVLRLIGDNFVANRVLSVFILIFPVLAIVERYGLKERAAHLISKLKNASAGKVLSIYMVVRSIASALNIRINGQVQFVRPLIYPMAEASAQKDKGGKLTDEQTEKLKGQSAAIENFGNFFWQNCFPWGSGALLIVGTLGTQFPSVTPQSVAFASVFIAVIALVLAIAQAIIFDKMIKKGGK